ncbi:MAG: hypothetical protein ACP5M4_12680 [Acidobacteriaceae bacterium]
MMLAGFCGESGKSVVWGIGEFQVQVQSEDWCGSSAAALESGAFQEKLLSAIWDGPLSGFPSALLRAGFRFALNDTSSFFGLAEFSAGVWRLKLKISSALFRAGSLLCACGSSVGITTLFGVPVLVGRKGFFLLTPHHAAYGR